MIERCVGHLARSDTTKWCLCVPGLCDKVNLRKGRASGSARFHGFSRLCKTELRMKRVLNGRY